MDATSILLVLLIVFTLLYTLLLFCLNWLKHWSPWNVTVTLSATRSLPVLIFVLSIPLIAVSATTRRDHIDGCEDELQMNNDIGGIGVLLGLFLPPCVLVLILIWGHFESYTFGAKELCVAQMASKWIELYYQGLMLTMNRFSVSFGQSCQVVKNTALCRTSRRLFEYRCCKWVHIHGFLLQGCSRSSKGRLPRLSGPATCFWSIGRRSLPIAKVSSCRMRGSYPPPCL
jgi:hypothetical protein